MKRMTERERMRAAMKRIRLVPMSDSRLENPLEDWSWRIWQAAKRDARRQK